MRFSQVGHSTQIHLFAAIGLLVSGIAMPVPMFAGQPALEKPYDSDTRFSVLKEDNREAVLDNKTGLVWERSPALDMSDWDMAQRRCSSKPAGDGIAWRVPTVQELATLVEPSSIEVKLPADHPFANVEASIYWSSTERRENGAYASFVDFGSGRSATLEKYMPTFVWCVSSGDDKGANRVRAMK